MLQSHSPSCLRILEKSIPLFANNGFDGVSMRDIARAVGVKAPALYNHFQDKESLYLAVVSHAFANKSASLITALSSSKCPEDRLESFIFLLITSMSEDQNFSRLLQRELLDGDEARLKVLGSTVFAELFQLSTELFREINPQCCDVNLLAVTVIGMIRQHFELQPLYRFLPGVSDKPVDPEALSEHIIKLLLTGIRG